VRFSELVDKIIEDGRLTADEYNLLLKTANEDGKIDKEERKGILRILDMKNKGELELVA
jgi:CBS domain containing-hemolysin-like protein